MSMNKITTTITSFKDINKVCEAISQTPLSVPDVGLVRAPLI